MHQARRETKADQIVHPETGTTPSPETCAQNCQLQCAQLALCNSENVNNENWRPVFIVVLADLLGPNSPFGY